LVWQVLTWRNWTTLLLIVGLSLYIVGVFYVGMYVARKRDEANQFETAALRVPEEASYNSI
jgi:hypothetical protein